MKMGLDRTGFALAWAHALVDELIRSGISHFFIAPGSRSTPLALAVARHADARSIVHFDERGTAFMALGAGRISGGPAAWITTSGTAVANAMPAVVEASTDHVPLVLLTADRPPELRQSGANQTIDQVKIFGEYVRWFFDMPVPDPQLSLDFVRSNAAFAVARARGPLAGPVHLNCMFREPLVPVQGVKWEEVEENPRRRVWSAARVSPDDLTINRVAAMISSAKRGVVVAGRLSDPSHADAVARLAAHLRWPLFSDVLSQARLGEDVGSARITYTDAVLAIDRPDLPDAPDCVLQFGAGLVSKRLTRYLASDRSADRMICNTSSVRVDPLHNTYENVNCDPGLLAAHIVARGEVAPRTSFYGEWRALDEATADRMDGAIEESNHLSEPAVARLTSRLVPSSHTLVLASSMPVRDFDTFAVGDGERVRVVANRGASGIDGTLATAIGVVTASNRPATLVCGDLALLHDLNSLAALRSQDVPLIIIAINNDGGGIFSFLPVSGETDAFETYFGTPHGLRFEHAARMFGVRYAAPTNRADFSRTYRVAVDERTPTLIEVTTDRATNRAEHERLFRTLARS